jgi:hypothetical protein
MSEGTIKNPRHQTSYLRYDVLQPTCPLEGTRGPAAKRKNQVGKLYVFSTNGEATNQRLLILSSRRKKEISSSHPKPSHYVTV